jgi:hypothetical protein
MTRVSGGKRHGKRGWSIGIFDIVWKRHEVFLKENVAKRRRIFKNIIYESARD